MRVRNQSQAIRAAILSVPLAIVGLACGSLLGVDFDHAWPLGLDAGVGAVSDGTTSDTTPQGDSAQVPTGDGGCPSDKKWCNGQCVSPTDPDYGCASTSCAPCESLHLAALCTYGICGGGLCEHGRADCDGNPGNGCEVDLMSSHDHCGKCTNACAAALLCNRGTCAGVCDDGLVPCSGGCVNKNVDTENCGTCGRVCSEPWGWDGGSTPACSGSVCGLECWAGYHRNCNQDSWNGECVAESPASCGYRCEVCPAPPNGTATCNKVVNLTSSWECGVDCSAGFHECGGACCPDIPVQVTAVATGTEHVCALMVDGKIKCWGRNNTGALGSEAGDWRPSSVKASDYPVEVVGLDSLPTAIAAGYWYTCAATSTGIRCWGSNDLGQLGNGSTTNSSSPVEVSGLGSGVTFLSAGRSHACAVVAGTVKCWGSNNYGQVGSDPTDAGVSSPVEVGGIGASVTAVAAGGRHTCVLTAAGGVKCWGANDYGQLGNGSNDDSPTPVEVTSLSSGVRAISAGYDFTCALTHTGVQCWGSNGACTLGNDSVELGGSYSCSRVPVSVKDLGAEVSAIAAGQDHACALTSGGAIKCWGSSEDGRLGSGSDGPDGLICKPLQAVGLELGMVGVSAGGAFTCGLTTSGTVKCWGSNDYSQLGNTTDEARWGSDEPLDVMGL